MSHLADRNEVNARFCDLADCFQGHPSARFEGHSGSLERNSLPQLGKCHIVEQNYVHSAESYKPSNLFERIRLEFDANARPLRLYS